MKKLKQNLETDIFNYKSKEFFINLKSSDIPPKGHKDRADFKLYEEMKCKRGVNINGIFIPPTLYWHLNHHKIPGADAIDENGLIVPMSATPNLRDTDWIIHNGLYTAEGGGDILIPKKALIQAGARQIGKSVNMSSIITRDLSLIDDCKDLLVCSNSGDIDVMLGYIFYGMDNCTDFFRVPRLTQDKKAKEFEFGIKNSDNESIVKSKLIVRNTQDGGKTEVGAGVTIYRAVLDEIAKAPTLNAYSAIKPALRSKFGYRSSPILTFTGGDVKKSKDAQSIFNNPSSIEAYEFETEGKKSGLFIGGWYRQDLKDESTLGKFLAIEDKSSELYSIRMEVTDFDRANKVLDEEEAEAAKSTEDPTAYIKHIIYHPRKVGQMFLTPDVNPFNIPALQRQKEFLLENPIGTAVTLEKINGKIKYNLSNKKHISEYPLTNILMDQDAPIMVYDFPKYSDHYDLHIMGCLTPGEKVLTSKGLKSVEDVTLKDKLVNKEGKEVEIYNLQQYQVDNEPTYKIKVSNTFRTTTFTKEHPILTSKSHLKSNKTIDENKFKFDFTKAENVEIGDWTISPNTYKENENIDLNSFWEIDTYRRNFNIPSPLYLKDFWWFIGLYLGDGCSYNEKGYVSITFNRDEVQSINKLKSICTNIFNRKCTESLKKGNCVEYIFNCKQLNIFLKEHFGKYSHGKYLSEWVKYISEEFKYNLLLGYLDSDGCITRHTKGYLSLEYVSVSLQLLEDVQDIAFSLGMITNISLMRKAKEMVIKGRIVQAKDCYHLRFSHTETLKLVRYFNDVEILKLSKINLNDLQEVRKKSKGNCFISTNGDFIYHKIKDIEENIYSGLVYNFECETHTFMCRSITTHNCDPYNQDKTATKGYLSLGSVYIFRRTHTDLQDNFQRTMVCSYTARPGKLKEFHRNVELLQEWYNGQILHEVSGNSLLQYFDERHKSMHIMDTYSIQKEMNPKSNSTVTKGLRATPNNNKFRLDVTLDYFDEDLGDGKTGYSRILDPVLCDELIAYDGEKNADRYDAFSYGIVHLYAKQKYNTRPFIVTSEELKPAPPKPIIHKSVFRQSNLKRGTFRR